MPERQKGPRKTTEATVPTAKRSSAFQTANHTKKDIHTLDIVDGSVDEKHLAKIVPNDTPFLIDLIMIAKLAKLSLVKTIV